MKLYSITLENFRCYKKKTKIVFDDFTALIGKNDSGKSTVMEALNIFLNDTAPDKDDGSKNGTPSEIIISCEFTELPDKVLLDDKYHTNLREEYLLNECGRLEILKKYNGDLIKPKCEGIFAFARHPVNPELADLLQLTNPKLKSRAKELGCDLSGIDPKVNAQLRQLIRDRFELSIAECEIPLNDDNSKKVWTGLKSSLPGFALFKSDRESTDQDEEAQDPLKAAIKEAIKEQESKLAQISEYVEKEVTKISNLTLKKLKEMDPSLASELKPVFTPPRWESLFKASITGDNDIPINKRGSGAKRLILLNFFRAKAEKLIKDKKMPGLIYGIEEPETSQHPNNQRLLLSALNELSINSQIVITTHTPILARALPDKQIRFIRNLDCGNREIVTGGESVNLECANTLGILPDHQVRVFIGLEGPNDIQFFKTISKQLISDGEDILDLEQMELNGELIFVPLGGSTLAQWVFKLKEFKRPEFYLFDRDTPLSEPPKYQEHANEFNSRDNCTALITKRKEIENYLHPTSIIESYKENGIQISLEGISLETADVPKVVAQAIYSKSGGDWGELNSEAKKKKISYAKKNLNSNATRYMSKARLAEVDPEGEVIGWFNTIKEILGRT